MAIERSWNAVPTRLFIQNGGADGSIILSTASGFRVKQYVKIESSLVSSVILEVKKVISETTILVGPRDKNINSRIDLSNFLITDSATISAEEQRKVVVPKDDQGFYTYEQEPVVARRVISVDEFGNFYSTENPLSVRLSDGSISIGTVNAELEVQLSHQNNVPNAGDVADSVRIGNGTNELAINPDGSINVGVVLFPAGAATEAKQDTQIVALNSIDTKLDNLAIEAMTEATNPDNIMTVGTLNGQKDSTKYGFVNNIKNQILASHDRVQAVTYVDFGNKNERITKIEYSSPTFPGTIASKNIAYSLISNKYRRDSITWVIV